MHFSAGDPDSARRYLQAATDAVSHRLQDSESTAHDLYNLAVYKAAAGEFREAAQRLAEAARKSPDEYRIREAAFDLRELGNVPGADTAELARLRALLEGGLG